MIRTAILSFSDGRERVHEDLRDYILDCEEKLIRALRETNDVEVVTPGDIIHSNKQASELSRSPVLHGIDACVFNVPVFSFPNYSAIAALLQSVPLLAIAPVNGSYPGLGGLQATVNLIRQTGGQCEKVWGNISEPQVLGQVMEFLRAARAATRLKGQVFGLFGGRSIGIGSGAVNPDLWMKKFGVDVDHLDQLEIIRRAGLVEDKAVEQAICWLEESIGSIKYDGGKLTRETLGMQVRCHIALKELIRERSLDFVAVKCHYELSEYYWTQCLSASLFNDPYDWDGAREPVVFSCEADADAALTMQIFKLVSDKPVLFLDFRHYLEKEGAFAFCNCGACATWYAKRSPNPAENLKHVTLHPLVAKYAGGGCHVKYIAAPGEMTFARLCREMDRYKLQVFCGEAVSLPEDTTDITCPVWPHCYVKVQGDPYELVRRFCSNHVHGVSGNYVGELQRFCELKNIELELL